MSISFGLQKAGSKRKPAAVIPAFEATVDESEPELTNEQKLTESQRLQDEGNLAADGNQSSAALRLWEQAIRLTPDRAVLHEQKAQVFLGLDRCWDAVQCAERATQLQADWADAHLTLSRAQLGLGEPELAMTSLQTVLQLQPDQEEARQELAEVRALVLRRKNDSAVDRKRLKTLCSSNSQSN